MPNIDLIFKNESASRTGSLKHRYAWALVFWALLEGHITQNTTVFEASSGNTATSEGYMLNLLGVNFVVIVPDTLEKIKEDRIRLYTSEIIKTYIGKRIERAEEEAKKRNGFFMNQFANADRV
uniref:Tryptophan synthase beta chain-like PALP domain-containing protein n=1 Tax=Panagrolaimus superbus TaxID=310955 RepID=A0A914YZE4_9BILA